MRQEGDSPPRSFVPTGTKRRRQTVRTTTGLPLWYISAPLQGA